MSAGEDIDGGVEPAVPTWAVFGDLMSVLLGAFVLILVSVVAVQLELSTQLEREVKQRQEETQRRQTLEQALAAPLAAGRVTLINGRIGISGSVLFALNSDQLQPEGREVLKSLIEPLSTCLLYTSPRCAAAPGCAARRAVVRASQPGWRALPTGCRPRV